MSAAWSAGFSTGIGSLKTTISPSSRDHLKVGRQLVELFLAKEDEAPSVH